jgi:hypothetical protein
VAVKRSACGEMVIGVGHSGPARNCRPPSGQRVKIQCNRARAAAKAPWHRRTGVVVGAQRRGRFLIAVKARPPGRALLVTRLQCPSFDVVVSSAAVVQLLFGPVMEGWGRPRLGG